jgi:hypothetical protein
MRPKGLEKATGTKIERVMHLVAVIWNFAGLSFIVSSFRLLSCLSLNRFAASSFAQMYRSNPETYDNPLPKPQYAFGANPPEPLPSGTPPPRCLA